jgi:hypothetical protein
MIDFKNIKMFVVIDNAPYTKKHVIYFTDGIKEALGSFCFKKTALEATFLKWNVAYHWILQGYNVEGMEKNSGLCFKYKKETNCNRCLLNKSKWFCLNKSNFYDASIIHDIQVIKRRVYELKKIRGKI